MIIIIIVKIIFLRAGLRYIFDVSCGPEGGGGWAANGRQFETPALEASPNQIVLVGPCFILTYLIYSVIFHVENSRSLILM